MKKILILTSFGKTDEPEETKLLHLYLASLKKHVVPYYDVKAILLNNFKIESCDTCQTTQQIKDYGLENVVEVKSIYEMGLSEKAIKYIEDLGAYVSVGAKLNLLFDYAKRHSFFDASWIFHVDSDSEFQENFSKFLEAFDAFPDNKRVITVSGDVHHSQIGTNEVNYTIQQADRVYIYDELTIPDHAFDATKKKITKGEVHDPAGRCGLRISPSKTKVRNDFVGFDRSFAESYSVNWLIEYYPLDCQGIDNHYSKNNKTEADLELISLLKNTNFKYEFTNDKGGEFEFLLKSGTALCCFRFELPPQRYMTMHIGGGWQPEDSWSGGNFIDRASKILLEEYDEYKHIWQTDWNNI